MAFWLPTHCKFNIKWSRILRITSAAELMLAFQQSRPVWSPAVTACCSQSAVKAVTEVPLPIQLKASVTLLLANSTPPPPQPPRSTTTSTPSLCSPSLWTSLRKHLNCVGSFPVQLLRNLEPTYIYRLRIEPWAWFCHSEGPTCLSATSRAWYVQPSHKQEMKLQVFFRYSIETCWLAGLEDKHRWKETSAQSRTFNGCNERGILMANQERKNG